MFFCFPDPHFKRNLITLCRDLVMTRACLKRALAGKNARRRIISYGLLSVYAYVMAPDGLSTSKCCGRCFKLVTAASAEPHIGCTMPQTSKTSTSGWTPLVRNIHCSDVPGTQEGTRRSLRHASSSHHIHRLCPHTAIDMQQSRQTPWP